MSDELYKQALEAAKSEMEELLEEQADLERKLSAIGIRLDELRKISLSIGELLGEDYAPEAIGITDAIRKVLAAEDPGRYSSAIAVRGLLQKDGFKLDEYKNALAVIHTTMKRLEDQGELESISRGGKAYYRVKEKTKITDEDIPF